MYDTINSMSKSNAYAIKVQKNGLIHIIIAVAVWLVIWIATVGIYISGILDRLPGEVNFKYIIATVWTLAILIIVLATTPIYRKAVLPKSKLLWLSIIPIALLILLPLHYNLPLPLPVHVFVITVTVFWQDYLTFGVLQSYLTTRISATFAAILTPTLFLLGHVIFYFGSSISPLFLLTAVSAFVWSFTRKYTGNIYIALLLHFCSYLI